MNYETVIGLEIHVQLKTQSKLFCGCSTRSASERDVPPNRHICPICTGHPGVLPRPINRKAVELAVRLASAVRSSIHPESDFDRKNYFYADLPKGYQITQHGKPLAEGGFIDFILDGIDQRIDLNHMHLEEDPGKSKIEGGVWLVDMNRCGIPLVEIVTPPDLRSASEAAAFVTEFRRIVRYLGVSEGNMEMGNLRCDANVSIRPSSSDPLGVKTEIKNLNSIRFLEDAVNWEIKRQIRVLNAGGVIKQITIAWDDQVKEGQLSREKESEADYRYFREPNLIPVAISEPFIADASIDLPELPARRLRRYIREHEISPSDAVTLIDERSVADYFESVLMIYSGATKRAADWVRNHVLRALNDPENAFNQINELPVTAEYLAELLDLMDAGVISDALGPQIFQKIIETGRSPKQIIEQEGLRPPEEDDLIQIIDQVLADDPETVRRYREGNDKVLNRLIGQVMKQTRGRADAQKVRSLLIERADAL